MKILKLSVLGLAVSAAFSVHAEEVVKANKVEPIRAEAELGVIVTTGNTETASYKGKVSVKHDAENWANQYLFDSLFKEDKITNDDGSTSTEKTAEKYFLSAQGDYKLNEKHSALFIYGSYEDDRFSGYEYQSSIAAGYSDQLFGNEAQYFNYNIGPGYTFNESDDGIEDESAMVRLAIAYEYKFSDHAKFNQDMSTELVFEDGSNSRSKSESAVSANLMGNLSLKVSYSVTHNSEVSDGVENTDTVTSMAVVYLF